MSNQSADPIVPLGTKVVPFGEVAAVGIREGERYYMLVDRHGDVSLMPASVIEPIAPEDAYVPA
jgi:hypothetical protein